MFTCAGYGVRSGKVYLLCFVEPVDFIQKQNSFPAITVSECGEKTSGANLFVNARLFFASSKTPRTSFIPTTVALSSLNIESDFFAKSLASVVLPQLKEESEVALFVRS